MSIYRYAMETPALVVSREEIDKGLSILDEVLKEVGE